MGNRGATVMRSAAFVTALTVVCMVFAVGMGAMAASERLVVWVGDGQPRLDEYQFVGQLFEKENPGITVDAQGQAGGQGQVMEKLALAIAAGAPPDASWLEGSAVLEFAAQGLLMDVTRAVADIRFAPADEQEMTLDGRMWAVPYHTAARGLFKRIDLFEQAGLDPFVDPETMDTLWAWNQKLTKRNPDGTYSQAGLVPWVGNWGAPAWIWTFGGKLIDIDGTKVTPTATYHKNVEAFEWLAEWGQFFGTRTPVSAGWGGLRDGKVAMSPESTSVVGRLIDANVPFITGRVPNPPGGGNGTWGGGTAIGVPFNVRNPELSLKLVRFFGEARVQIERFSYAPNVLPANWEALLAVGRRLPREWQGVLDQFPEARARTPLWIEYYVNQLNPGMNAVVDGKKTPQQALNDVQIVMEARFRDVFGD
ncbi:MAG: extracellular solute-binding protein [Limnochordia bacterium]|jgi:multiple sugar transport system substrate-binding protein